MTDIPNTVMVCLFVFLAGFIDSIAGGGGLISLPAYVATGIPMHMALASNKFSSTCGSLVSSLRFARHKKVHFGSVGISIVCALAGSAIGARTVLLVGDYVLKILLLGAIPVVAFLVILKKDFGHENKVDSINPRIVFLLSGVIGLVLGFYDGFFGPGTGTFLIFAYTILLRFDLATASGNAKFVNFASNIGALCMFLYKGQVNFALAVPAAVFGIAGNYLGSGLAVRWGAKVIRPVFVAALLLLIINIVRDMI